MFSRGTGFVWDQSLFRRVVTGYFAAEMLVVMFC